MADDGIKIAFSADTSAFKQGCEQATTAVSGIGPQIQSLVKLFEDIKDPLERAITGFRDAAKALSALGGGGGRLHEVAGQVRQVGQAASSVGASTPGNLRSVSSALHGLSEGISGMGARVAGGLQGASQSLSTFVGGLAERIPGAGSALRGLSGAILNVGSRAASGVASATNFASSLTSGLATAAEGGGAELLALGGAAAGVATGVAALAAAAVAAGSTLASWAASTRNSATASAAARQAAAGLDDSMQRAAVALNAVGGTMQGVVDQIASAFAPVMSMIVDEFTSLTNAFEESYNSGGLVKTVIDGLVDVFKGLAVILAAVVTSVKLQIDVTVGLGKAWSDAINVILTLVRDLWDWIANKLQPVITALQGAATAAWTEIRSGFDGLVKFVVDRYQDWVKQNPLLVTAITSIGMVFKSVESVAGVAIQRIIGWINDLIGGLQKFLNALPGVHVALQSLHDDVGKLAATTNNDVHGLSSAVGSIVSPQGGASIPPPSPANGGAPAAGGRHGQQRHQGGAGHADAPATACDPAAAAACQAATEDSRNDASQAGSDERVKVAQAGNTAIQADNQAVTTAVKAQQAAQTAAVGAAAQDQVKVSNQTTQQATDNNNRTLNSFKQAMDQTVSSFTKGLVQMAEGTKTFAQVLGGIGQQILNDFISKVIDPLIEKWLWKEARQTLAHLVGIQERAAADVTAAATSGAVDATANREQITEDAKVAYANVYKALSGIPIVGPFLAPAGAAAAFAAVEAFSAAGGMDIPSGINPLTQLHAQEMVLPARLANPMRDMLAGFSGSGGGGGGDAHLHYAPTINAPQAQTLRQMLTDQGGDMLAFVQRALRDGSLKLA